MGEICDKLEEKILILTERVKRWGESDARKPEAEKEFRDLETNLEFAAQHLEMRPPNRDAAQQLYKEALGQAKSLGIP